MKRPKNSTARADLVLAMGPHLLKELLQALAIEPCHNTTHLRKYICDEQKAEAYDNVLAVLGLVEPPRKLHSNDCCSRTNSDEYKELARWLKRGLKNTQWNRAARTEAVARITKYKKRTLGGKTT